MSPQRRWKSIFCFVVNSNPMVIKARSVFGNEVELLKERFRLRVSAYAIIEHEEKMLLVNMRNAKKWFYPSGEVEMGVC